MRELWLIAHKVRGEPAFDIATQIDCPECQYVPDGNYTCHECDELGYWWIIPTSGHRAYPYFHIALDELLYDTGKSQHEYSPEALLDAVPPAPPPDLPDHYQTRAEPSRIEQLKAMLPPKPVYRRF
jgi:hypothetical protein